MRNVNATKVIISAYSTKRTAAQNKQAGNTLVSDLTLVGAVESFRDVTSLYGGHFEESQLCFLKPGRIQEGIDELSDLAAEYLQACILVIHGDNAAELAETGPKGRSAIIGTFQAVEAPLPGEDYTKADDTFYVVR